MSAPLSRSTCRSSDGARLGGCEFSFNGSDCWTITPVSSVVCNWTSPLMATAGTSMLKLPVSSAVVVPTTVPPDTTLIVWPGAAVPVKT